MKDNLWKLTLIVLIILAVFLFIKGISSWCWSDDWNCRIAYYERQVDACMATERLPLYECKLMASQN